MAYVIPPLGTVQIVLESGLIVRVVGNAVRVNAAVESVLTTVSGWVGLVIILPIVVREIVPAGPVLIWFQMAVLALIASNV